MPAVPTAVWEPDITTMTATLPTVIPNSRMNWAPAAEQTAIQTAATAVDASPSMPPMR